MTIRRAFSTAWRSRRAAVLGLVAGGLLGAASAAVAATAYSTLGQTPTIDGHAYYNESIMYTIPTLPHDEAETDVWTTHSENVAPGWMGVDARKFKDGSICGQTGYQYNNTYTYWQYVDTSNACGSGTYYSQGVFAIWNGSSYDYYYTYPTPSLNG